MKKLGLLIAAAALGAASMAAQADTAWSVQYSMYGADGTDLDAVEASYRTSELLDIDNVSLEAFFGLGIGDDNGVELDNTLGVEGYYTYELNDGFSVEGILGYARYKVSYDLGILGSGSDSDSDLIIGIAGTYELGSGTAFLEWRDIGDIDGIDIGYRMPLN